VRVNEQKKQTQLYLIRVQINPENTPEIPLCVFRSPSVLPCCVDNTRRHDSVSLSQLLARCSLCHARVDRSHDVIVVDGRVAGKSPVNQVRFDVREHADVGFVETLRCDVIDREGQ
jgi:hypothetical protein